MKAMLFFECLAGKDLMGIAYIKNAVKRGIGTVDIERANVKKITTEV